jgi:hypothetical protein
MLPRSISFRTGSIAPTRPPNSEYESW